MITKADKVRTILKRDLGKKTEEQILASVIRTTGFSKGLAKTYIRNNTEKMKVSRKVAKKTSKKTSKKTGTTKKTAAKKRASKKAATKKRK